MGWGAPVVVSAALDVESATRALVVGSASVEVGSALLLDSSPPRIEVTMSPIWMPELELDSADDVEDTDSEVELEVSTGIAGWTGTEGVLRVVATPDVIVADGPVGDVVGASVVEAGLLEVSVGLSPFESEDVSSRVGAPLFAEEVVDGVSSIVVFCLEFPFPMFAFPFPSFSSLLRLGGVVVGSASGADVEERVVLLVVDARISDWIDERMSSRLIVELVVFTSEVVDDSSLEVVEDEVVSVVLFATGA